MRLEPLGNKVVVERDPEEEKLGSILLPDQAREKPRKGKVVAVGPGKMLDNGQLAPMPVVVGDVILFRSWAGEEFGKHAKTSENQVIMTADDVLAIVRD